jgi:hypothetical protein
MVRFVCRPQTMRGALAVLSSTLTFGAATLAGTTGACAQSRPVAIETQGWTTYRSPAYGFSFAYPDGLFKLDQTVPQANGGGIWLSDDRSARLIATSGANAGRDTLATYREALIRDSYAAAKLTYAPNLTNAFVLSGTIDGPNGPRMFYERVSFVCEGRFIYGWQMMYPLAQARKFDRIVEALARSYKPGRGPNGNCSE